MDSRTQSDSHCRCERVKDYSGETDAGFYSPNKGLKVWVMSLENRTTCGVQDGSRDAGWLSSKPQQNIAVERSRIDGAAAMPAVVAKDDFRPAHWGIPKSYGGNGASASRNNVCR